MPYGSCAKIHIHLQMQMAVKDTYAQLHHMVVLVVEQQSFTFPIFIRKSNKRTHLSLSTYIIYTYVIHNI